MAFSYHGNPFENQRTLSDYMQVNENHAMKQRMGEQNIAASQQEMGMNDEKIKAEKIERAVQYLGMATPENWQAIRQQAISEGLGNDQMIPMEFDPNWIQQTKSAFISASDNIPASMQEYNFYNRLGSKEEKQTFMDIKRAQPYLNTGGNFTQPGIDGGVRNEIPVTPKPDQMPAFQAAQESEKIKAKTQTESAINLPNTLAKAQQSIDVIDQMIGNKAAGKAPHKGFESAVGVKIGNPSYGFGIKDKAIAGTDAADFEALFDQVGGAAFLEAFESLKGGGQITEVEGNKATSAITRMKLAQSEEDFIKAATEFRDVLSAGMGRAKQKAGAPSLDTVIGAPSSAESAAPVTSQRRWKRVE